MTTQGTAIDEIIENFSLLDEWDDRYRYLIELGAKTSGHWQTGHMSPIDANAPDVETPQHEDGRGNTQSRYDYPYGISVNALGVRFFDEGLGGTVGFTLGPVTNAQRGNVTRLIQRSRIAQQRLERGLVDGFALLIAWKRA